MDAWLRDRACKHVLLPSFGSNLGRSVTSESDGDSDMEVDDARAGGLAQLERSVRARTGGPVPLTSDGRPKLTGGPPPRPAYVQAAMDREAAAAAAAATAAASSSAAASGSAAPDLGGEALAAPGGAGGLPSPATPQWPPPGATEEQLEEWLDQILRLPEDEALTARADSLKERLEELREERRKTVDPVVDFLHQVEPQMEREPEMEQEPLMDRGRVISFTRCWRLFSRAGSRGRWVTQIWQPGRWYGQRATMDPRFAGEFVTYSAQTCGTEIWRPLLRAGQWYHQVWQPGRWHCPPGTFAYAAEGELVIYLTPQWRLLWRAGRWESQLERYGQRWESQHSQDAGGSPAAGGERLEIGMRERLEAAMRSMRSRGLENGIVSHCLVCNDTPSRSMMCPRCDRIFRDLVKWAASLVPTSFPPSWLRSTRSCVSDDSGASVILLCPVCLTDLPAEAADAWTSSSPYINSFCPICKESLLHTVRWARFGYDFWV